MSKLKLAKPRVPQVYARGSHRAYKGLESAFPKAARDRAFLVCFGRSSSKSGPKAKLTPGGLNYLSVT